MMYQKPSCELLLFTQTMVCTLSDPDSFKDNETPRLPMP